MASLSASIPAKETLKMMARTKNKNLVPAGGLLLFIAALGIIGFGVFHEWRVAHYPNLAGHWEGTMLLGFGGIRAGEDARTHVVLNLVKTNGSYIATTDLVELGRKGIPLGKVVYHYPYLSIEGCPMNVFQNPPGTWKLRINPNATQMLLDHWINFSQPGPVLFLRTATPDPVPTPLTEEDFAPRPGSECQGYWQGQYFFDTNDIDVMDTNELPVNLKIADQGNGVFRAEMDWSVFGADRVPATGHYQGSSVKFTDDIGHGLFEGTVGADDNELIGSWTMSGKARPLCFKRADYRAVHARDNEKDYSFDTPNDLPGHWKGSYVATVAKKRVTFCLALDIAKMADGSCSATVTYTNLFGADEPIPCSEFEFHPPDLKLELKWWKSGYQGTLKNGKLVGIWHGAHRTFPVTFERNASQP